MAKKTKSKSKYQVVYQTSEDLAKAITDKYKKCPKCKGSGANPNNPEKDCKTCDGEGIVEK